MYTTSSFYYFFSGDVGGEAFQSLVISLGAEHTGILGRVTKPGHVDGPTVGSFICELFDQSQYTDAAEGLRALSAQAESIPTHSKVTDPEWLHSVSEMPLDMVPSLAFDLIRLALPEVGLTAIHFNTIHQDSGRLQYHDSFYGNSMLFTEHFQVDTSLSLTEVTQLVEAMESKSVEEIGELYINTFVAPLLKADKGLITGSIEKAVSHATLSILEEINHVQYYV